MQSVFASLLLGGLVLGSLPGMTFAQTFLSPSQGNPVIPVGPPGSWDSGIAFFPEVVVQEGVHYAFYCGAQDLVSGPLAIGYATSADGLAWEKSPANPVFEGDGTGFDAFVVCDLAVVVDGDTWVLYYDGSSTTTPSPGIGRATAPDPAGPWMRSPDPVLTSGSASEWDSALVFPDTVVATEEGFVMYYTGSTGFTMPLTNMQIGLATSPDGINWTKYNDPDTANAPFAESDPVLELGPPGSWDANIAWSGVVRETASGWEIFYAANAFPGSGLNIGYAKSSDGIVWTKSSGNPILEAGTEFWAPNDLIPKSVMVRDSTYFLYYHGFSTGINAEIGVATAPAEETLYFAQFGSGEGFTSDLVLPNPSGSSISGRADFFNDDGEPLVVGLVQTDPAVLASGAEPLQLVSSINFSIAPLDLLTVSTDGLGDLVAGSAVVTSSGALGGVIRFHIPGIGIAGVGVSLPLSSFIVPVRQLASGISTGVAIYNAEGSSVTLKMTLRRQGAEVAMITIEDFPPHGHLAKFIHELFPGVALNDFEGTLVVEATGGRVAATALELGSEAGQFTTLPVTALTSK